MKTRINLFLANALIVTLTIIFSTCLYLVQIRDDALHLVKQDQEEAIKTFWQLIRTKGTDFRIVDGRLMAGDYPINGNHDLPDKIREIFGGTATIFMGDTRVSTNVLTADGARAVGTKLTGPAHDAIFKADRPYRGEASILDIPYFTAYDPIRNGNGETIGVLYVGTKKSEFLTAYSRRKNNIIVGTVVIAVLFIVLGTILLWERNRYEVLLLKSEQKYRTLFTKMLNGFALHEVICEASGKPVDYRFLEINEAFEVQTGLKRETLIGRTVREVLPAIEEEWIERYRAVALTGHPDHFEIFTRELDRWFEVSAYSPKRGQVAVTCADITNRRKTEARIEEMAVQMKLITDSVPVNIAYVDQEMRYRFVNRGYEEWFALQREEIVGRSIEEILTPAVFAGIRRHVEAALAGERTTFVNKMVKLDGSTGFLQASYVPHRVADRVVGFFVLVSDITASRQAEESIRASEERYRAVFNTTGTATVIIEDDTVMSLVNNEFTKLSGYPRDEIEGKLSWSRFISVPDRARMLAYHRARRDVPGSAPAQYECELVRKDGAIRHILVHVNLIPGTGQSVASFLDITKLKELQEALRNQLNFLQTLIDAIPSPIFYKDRSGRYLGYNRAFAESVGLTRDQLIGKTVHDVAPPEVADQSLAMDEALFTDPGVQVYEYSLAYADGTRHEVIFNKATFTGEDGRVAGLVGVVLDVTKRKKAEDLLAEREEFLSNIFESIQDGISILDKELRLIRANPVLERRFSDRMPIVGRKCFEAYHGRTEPCEPCPSLETLRNGKPSSKIFSRVENGTEVWLEVCTFPLFDSKKSHITGVVEYTRDVTERNRSEAALRESEERFHLVFAQNDDAIILVRMDSFAIIDANQAAEELTGYTRNELRELTPCSFIDPEDFRTLIDTIPIEDYSRAFRLDRATSTRKDGSIMCVSIRCKMLRLRDERIIHCSIRDITEKLHLEEEIRATQAKLIQTNKMASLGMLSSSVAHEINNPNNYISVNASMLTEVWQDAEQILRQFHEETGEFNLRGVPYSKMQQIVPRLFNGIVEGSRRITAIIDSMKDFVREDKSGLHVELDINKLIRNATSILWHHIHDRTDNFQMVLEDDIPTARGNGQQIEQVIINLLMNALQALPDKNGSVCIMTSCHPEARAVIITVRDEGEGMNKDVAAHMREPFFTTRQDKGGTGLGLYISDSIIKEHRGSLEFTSKPGKGTVATIRLPTA